MLHRFIICALVFCFILTFISTERRIVNGKPADKRYAVYIVKSELSTQLYDEWMCGGAIVSPVYVVTSAACIQDVEYMYVIAGYKKYIHPDKINEDPCTKTHKKKVTYVCLPQAYNFSYPDIEKWSWLDIAVAMVESPYNFHDTSYKQHCSYQPIEIPINYEERYQKPGIDALALGWGHQHLWRSTNDSRNLNSEYLLGASVLIEGKPLCKSTYGNAYPKILALIDRYMICTIKKGNIDTQGDLIKRTHPSNFTDGCEPAGALRGSGLCNEDKFDYDLWAMRRNNTNENGGENVPPVPSRRDGICQNDHGGPLVTWVGSREVLIGIASVFRINSTTNECIGPYLFTSTWCSSAFLHCIITNSDNFNDTTRRRNVCDKPLREQGLTLIERELSWAQHPDGPAENEIIRMRPQVSLNDIYRQEN